MGFTADQPKYDGDCKNVREEFNGWNSSTPYVQMEENGDEGVGKGTFGAHIPNVLVKSLRKVFSHKHISIDTSMKWIQWDQTIL